MQTALLKQGFIRVVMNQQLFNLNTDTFPLPLPSELSVVVDRLTLDQESRSRLVEALEAAFRESEGRASVIIGNDQPLAYSSHLSCPGCGRTFPTPRPVSFSFNHPLGACPECKGFGNILRYDERLLIPDPQKSLLDGVIEPWTKPSNRWWQKEMLKAFQEERGSTQQNPTTNSPKGNGILFGKARGRSRAFNDFFEYLEGKRYKMHVRVFLSRYRSPSPCTSCQGTRLRPEALMVKIHQCHIHEVCGWPLSDLQTWLAIFAVERI